MAVKKGSKKGRVAKVRKDNSDDSGQLPKTVPVLPAKDLVAFPGVMMSLYVGRESSIRAIEKASEDKSIVCITAQRTQEHDDPKAEDLYDIGVMATIVRTLKLPDGRAKVLLQGLVRVKINKLRQPDGYFVADVEPITIAVPVQITAEDESIVNRIREHLQILVEREHLPEEMLLVTEEVVDPGLFADVILAHYRLDVPTAQRALEELDPIKRLRITDKVVSDDVQQFMLSERIRDRTQTELTKGQQEFFLREQIKQIQKELGEVDGQSEDLQLLKKQLKEVKLPTHAQVEADKQLRRIERMSPESSEYALLRTYLEWLTDLPWSKTSQEHLDLKRAKKILDEDHFGLAKVKDRIIEFLSVRKLNKDTKGPILCFVGPPGVGKTSLGRSIAKALNRKFFRFSLGGMRDEAEIRGHRRTYVGALPGRILQGLKQAGTRNPVIVLDELDKIGADFRGDPSSALLEVLDPQQNHEFSDHYLNLDFNLSDVLFIATANSLDTIPDALLDRLEIISIPGYTDHEKLAIAKKYLLPRQVKENGLNNVKLHIPDPSIMKIIERYTREAGVRNLEREVGSLLRKIARRYAETKKINALVDAAMVETLLGPTKYDPERDEDADAVGLVRGLAWTTLGGEVMPVEALVAKGTGQLTLTGQLGEVMQESAKAALFYARANASLLGIESDFSSKVDIHVHLPAGATPKDGPSAGITMVTALVSALTNRPVSRKIAMTGEVTLRGNVLPIGGLREKALAALQRGIKKVIIPFDNIKDLEEIPKEQREQITFVPVKHVGEVLEIALLGSASVKSRRKHPRRRKGQIEARI